MWNSQSLCFSEIHLALALSQVPFQAFLQHLIQEKPHEFKIYILRMKMQTQV